MPPSCLTDSTDPLITLSNMPIHLSVRAAPPYTDTHAALTAGRWMLQEPSQVLHGAKQNGNND
jgi:hypothetical protein